MFRHSCLKFSPSSRCLVIAFLLLIRIRYASFLIVALTFDLLIVVSGRTRQVTYSTPMLWSTTQHKITTAWVGCTSVTDRQTDDWRTGYSI